MAGEFGDDGETPMNDQHLVAKSKEETELVVSYE